MDKFKAITAKDALPVKDLPPREKSGNVRRTRDNFHGDKNIRPSSRSPASGGVSSDSYDTPSDAA